MTACIQFARCLTALIGAWIVFYLLNFLTANGWVHGLEAWIDLINNMQAGLLFACYWILTAITVPSAAASTTNPDTASSSKPYLRDSITLPNLFSYLLGIVVLFQIADIAVHTPGARFLFQLLSGMAVGICMALMVGCLESEYLNTPRICTACLYGYSVLQLAYIGFNSPDVTTLMKDIPPATIPVLKAVAQLTEPQRMLQLISTALSLPLKLLFIGICYWHIQSGRLAFYMEEARALINDEASEHWKMFKRRNAE